MNQMIKALAIVVLLHLLLVAAGAPASDRALCTEGFLQVVTPDTLSVSTNQCRAVTKQTMAAWKFDADQMHWTNPLAMEYPVTLRLLSVARMKTEHAGLLGFASGRDLFVVSASVLNDPFANGTLAHELAHIQAKRALGKLSERHLVPRYFIEGHGNIMGLAYRDHLHVTKHDYDVRKAREIAKFTADEARTILTLDSYGAVDKTNEDKMEAMGIFFVEYLRVRLLGKGIPDVLPRMGRVFELVGAGRTYQSAFQEQFRTSVDKVVADIVAFMGRTESAPAARLKGTRYEEFLKPQIAQGIEQYCREDAPHCMS
jgi:hypothetical protein